MTNFCQVLMTISSLSFEFATLIAFVNLAEDGSTCTCA